LTLEADSFWRKEVACLELKGKRAMSRKKPLNRVFDKKPKAQPSGEQSQEEKIKALAQEAYRRRRAKRELDCVLESFHGKKSLIQLLPALKRRCSRAAVQIALERIRRRWTHLSVEDQVFVSQFEASLKKEEAC